MFFNTPPLSLSPHTHTTRVFIYIVHCALYMIDFLYFILILTILVSVSYNASSIPFDKVEHTINEKNILFCIDCKFIVRLYDYFQDVRCLYFVLEFVNGGEMFTIIQKQKRRRFTEEQTKFFAGLALELPNSPHSLSPSTHDQKAVPMPTPATPPFRASGEEQRPTGESGER